MAVQTVPVDLPLDDLAEYCRQNAIVQMSLFGSALRGDFGANSDVDLLVTFASHAGWGLFDLVRMRHELSDLLGRPVDLVERVVVERSQNPMRQRDILESALVVYERN